MMRPLRKFKAVGVGAFLLIVCRTLVMTVFRENELVGEINRTKLGRLVKGENELVGEINRTKLGRLVKDTDYNQLKVVMKERADILRQKCTEILGKNNNDVKAGGVYRLLEANSYILCSVPKSGSTYWAQVFLAISGHLDGDNFENIDREYIHYNKEKIAYWKRDPYSMANKTLIVTTRNPWHRIYSAYVDKVSRVQLNFVHEVQNMLAEKGQYSGKIPTFQQFLTYIISSHQKGLSFEPHWRPVSNLCQVCRYNYTYVLKMESFVDDSEYLLSKIFNNNIDKSRAFYLYLTQKHDDDETLKLVRQFTNQYRQMRNIFKFTDTMKRLWNSFQSQGLLSDEVAFNDYLFENMSSDNVSEIVDIFNSKRKEKILSPAEKRQQRQKHFKHAYSKIDVNILKGIQEVYANDFLLFSYDPDIKAYL